MKKMDKNISNQCVLVCFTAFFSHKTSNFNEIEQKWPGLTYFDTVLHPHLLKFFNAVFARTRGIYLRMIMPSDFLLRRAVFFWRKKNLGGVEMTPPRTSRVNPPFTKPFSSYAVYQGGGLQQPPPSGIEYFCIDLANSGVKSKLGLYSTHRRKNFQKMLIYSRDMVF